VDGGRSPQHIVQLVAVQLHFPVQEDDEALAAARLQVAKVDHLLVVPCNHSEAMDVHFLSLTADYKDAQVIDLLFAGILHRLEDQEVLAALHTVVHPVVQQSTN